MLKKIISLSLVVLLLFAACRKEPLDTINPDRRYCSTYVEQFNTIWTGIDQGYVFWDRDTVQWDDVYSRMLPRFEQFDSKGGASDAELSQAYADMVHGLIDHHMYVQVKNLKTGNAIYADPAWDEVPMRDYYHYTYYNQQVALIPSMSGVEQRFDGNDDFNCCAALFGDSDGKKIAYLRFRSFSASSTYSMIQAGYVGNAALAPLRVFYGGNGVGGVQGGWVARDDVKAIILDLRGNGGGNLGDIQPLITSLNTDRAYIGYSRHKEGLGRLDYSSWVRFYIDPHYNHLSTDKQVVLLVDVNSVSCSELSAMLIREFPQGTIIGERTYGATCPLLPGNHDMLYSGVFGNYGKLGYYVYTSNFDVVDNNYQSLEGVGVTPDIECLFDYNALLLGHDNQLERALQFIKEGK